ncbi:hypothetical protein RHGRI_019000 [Rhododendron griersonianum]|uniref:DUF7722 domain-containing protein n=1 Tax=Rhododendron griersonianum TaxID=479676 RepID=A0AAV6JEJ2_9ERIC|nr:hypothetical protein RHGRI_019000 [Rhododendron griersonianum]
MLISVFILSQPKLGIIAVKIDMSGRRMESYARPPQKLGGSTNGYHVKEQYGYFQMPLHYPRYTKAEYEAMPEWKLDCLLTEYGLPVTGDVSHKRKFAIGAFLWPH